MEAQSPYFPIAEDWAAFAKTHDIPHDWEDPKQPPQLPIVAAELDTNAAKEYQEQADQAWAQTHPPDEIGYSVQTIDVSVRDGTAISVRISFPATTSTRHDRIREHTTLPMIYVIHGGGYISGSHLSEEAWLTRPLMCEFNLVTVSVEYRLAPEHKFPTWINDVWDVFDQVRSRDTSVLPAHIRSMIDFDRIILAGSSAGGGICATMSQKCRDQGIELFGVILNVPMLCDYRHFPNARGVSQSFVDCNQAFLGSQELATCWKLVNPGESAETQRDPRLSPLLGDVYGLSSHLVIVAGRDPLRDEGLEYVRMLQNHNVSTELLVYRGVPHHFAQIEELRATGDFHNDLKRALRSWIGA